MSDLIQTPKLRWPLNVQRHTISEKQFVVIECPLGLLLKPLILESAWLPVLAALEGGRSISELATQFLSHGADEKLIREFVQLLDNNFLLDNTRFQSAREQLVQEFADSPVRPSALAGRVYSQQPAELTQEIEQYLKQGLRPSLDEDSLVGLISPHIDYRRGGSTYGRAYASLTSGTADRYIVIGTSHQYSTGMFHLLKKDFQIPLGTLKCDRELVESLALRYGSERSFRDQYLHKKEHSLELQLPFLIYAQQSAKIVPILVGSFHHSVEKQRSPRDDNEYSDFADALSETIKSASDSGLSVAFIAGVDMAHVGKQFGDSFELTTDILEGIRERDNQYLRAVCSGDPEILFQHIAEDGDQRRMCGFPTLYTILDVTRRLGWKVNTEIIDYQQAVDVNAGCCVTFAAAAMRSQA
jgi:AmmeMemoRadiSam system protein B